MFQQNLACACVHRTLDIMLPYYMTDVTSLFYMYIEVFISRNVFQMSVSQ